MGRKPLLVTEIESKGSMNVLPNEIVFKIFLFFIPEDLLILALVSKAWKVWAEEDLIWQSLLPTEYAHTTSAKKIFTQQRENIFSIHPDWMPCFHAKNLFIENLKKLGELQQYGKANELAAELAAPSKKATFFKKSKKDIYGKLPWVSLNELFKQMHVILKKTSPIEISEVISFQKRIIETLLIHGSSSYIFHEHCLKSLIQFLSRPVLPYKLLMLSQVLTDKKIVTNVKLPDVFDEIILQISDYKNLSGLESFKPDKWDAITDLIVKNALDAVKCDVAP